MSRSITTDGRARRRGTAQIEMVFCALLLLVVAFLARGAWTVHRARQDVTANAHRQAFSLATAGKLDRFTSRFGYGGPTRSHPTIVRPTLGRYRLPRGFPRLTQLPSEAYVGRARQRVTYFTGERGRHFRGAASYELVIATGPPWTLHGSEAAKSRRFYEQLAKFSFQDAVSPLRLAHDPISRRVR